MIGRGQAAAGAGADRFASAWQAVRSDSSIQFNLAPPPSPPQPPPWLRAFFEWLGRLLEPVGRFLRWIAGLFPGAAYAQLILWTLLAAGAAAMLWAIYNRLKHGRWTLRVPRLADGRTGNAELEWSPEPEGARSWLEEADALAREGRFADAVHHLLFRSIEDLAHRRPALVRPALTSRELAASPGIPARARSLFAAIAGLVERSLFGLRPVTRQDWLEAREAYSDFALPSAWRS